MAVTVYCPGAALLFTVMVAGLVWVVMLIVVGVLPVLSVMFQVTVAVTSTWLPPAVANTVSVPDCPLAIVKLGGMMVMPVTFISETVTVEVPLAAPEDAVIVEVPELAPVIIPPAVMGATFASLLDQKTLLVSVLVLPSSKVPVALICRLVPC